MDGRGGLVDDDEVSRATYATDDEVDEDDDGHVEYAQRFFIFSAIGRNQFNIRKLTLYPYDPPLSVEDWLTLGRSIGTNTNLKNLHIGLDGNDPEEDEMMSNENLEAFCVGMSYNRSLNFFFMEEFDFSRARLELLHPFLIENDNLSDFQLHVCGLSVEDIQRLANAFGQRRNPASIATIALTGRDEITDESVPAVVGLCGHCPRLQKLYLGYSGIGNQGCNELALLLQHPESKLKCLILNKNTAIGDEGAQVLANAIMNNKKLKRLELSGCSVTAGGWNCFFRTLCDPTSIDATQYQSNHTLVSLWWSIYNNAMVSCEDLSFCMLANTEIDKRMTARKKIFHFHLNGNFDTSPFLDMDLEVLPYALGWIGKDGYANDISRKIRWSAFYRILRNAPDICSFLTFDRKVRNQLEVENAALKAKIEEERAENGKLKQQIEQLTLNDHEGETSKRKKCNI